MSDVYKIGVEIAITNAFSGVLSKLTSELTGVDDLTKKIGVGFGSWEGLLAAAGAVVIGELVSGLKDLVKESEKLVHVQEQIRAGYKDQAVAAADIKKATSAAYDVGMKHGQPVERVLSDMKELRQVFGSMDEAISFADKAEGLRTIGNSMIEGHGDKVKEELYNTARIGELRGISQDPQAMGELIDAMARIDQVSGGKINAKEMLHAVQYGRIASQGWDKNFFNDYLPSIVQEMGGMQAGNALMTMFGSGVQGRVTKRSLTMAEHYGLVGDPSKIIYDKLGDPRGANPGWEINTGGMMSNPFAWVQNDLNKKLQEHGVNTGVGSLDALMAYSGLNGARTGAQVVAVMGLQGGRLEKDANLFRNASGLAGEKTLLEKDPVAVDNRLDAAEHNLKTALGEDLVPTVLKAKNAFSDFLDAGTKYAREHPGILMDAIKSTTPLGVYTMVPDWIKNHPLTQYDPNATNQESKNKDFTLGAGGGFSKSPTFTHDGGFGYVSNFSQMQLGPMAHQKMDEFTSALKTEGVKAEAVAKDIAEKIKEMLSFTASPKINMPNAPTSVPGQKVEIHSSLHVGGRQLAKATQSAILHEHRTVSASNSHDGGSHWAMPDVG